MTCLLCNYARGKRRRNEVEGEAQVVRILLCSRVGHCLLLFPPLSLTLKLTITLKITFRENRVILFIFWEGNYDLYAHVVCKALVLYSQNLFYLTFRRIVCFGTTNRTHVVIGLCGKMNGI